MQTALLIQKKVLTQNAVELTLKTKTPYHYQPGQYLTLALKVKGKTLQRCYSFASTPQRDRKALSSEPSALELKLAIKKVPGGAMSSFIVDCLKVGEKVQLSEARGAFNDGKTRKERLFFAAGSGISPNFSLIQAGVEQGLRQQLFYFNLNAASVMYKSDLEQLQARDKNFTCHFFLGGIVHFETIYALRKKHRLSKTATYFICGPEGMMDNTKAALEYYGVPEEQLKFEYFQLDSRSGIELLQTEKEFILSVNQGKKQKRIAMTPQESVLEALLKAKVRVPYSCRNGVCGTCLVKKEHGEFLSLENSALTPEEKRQGYCLSCLSYPLSREISVTL